MDWREFIIFSRLDQQYSDIATILGHRSEVMISHDFVLSGTQFKNCIAEVLGMIDNIINPVGGIFVGDQEGEHLQFYFATR